MKFQTLVTSCRAVSLCLVSATVLTTTAISTTAMEQGNGRGQAPQRLHLENALGTSLDLSVYGIGKAKAEVLFDELEQALARLEGILSTYQKDSELSQLNRSGTISEPSPELAEIVRQCESWWRRSDKRFSCRMAEVIEVWEHAELQQQPPDRISLRKLAWSANRTEFDIDGDTLVLPEPVKLAPDGLAKGYIIDRLADLLSAKLDGAAFKLDIGGDAIYVGSPPGREAWEVAIADPLLGVDNANYIARLALKSQAIAASGHHSRARRIDGREYSHILQPRDGWPVDQAPAAIVVAQDALTADAIATALTTTSLSSGIDWVNSMDGVEALLISDQGRQLASAHWDSMVRPEAESLAGSAKASVRVRYEVPRLKVAEYHRPYLSLWITDGKREPVRNLLLLGETERWARENRRWWRSVGRQDPGLLDGIARPTRSPGVYDVIWDGRDDFGRPMPDGEYVLNIEASRESGGSSYRRVPFTLGQASRKQVIEAEGELGRVQLQVKNET